jgi:hypothetical protein
MSALTHSPAKNHYQWRKSAADSTCIASFRPLAVTSGPGRHLAAFSSKEQGSYWCWGPRSIRERSVLHKASIDELVAS